MDKYKEYYKLFVLHSSKHAVNMTSGHWNVDRYIKGQRAVVISQQAGWGGIINKCLFCPVQRVALRAWDVAMLIRYSLARSKSRLFSIMLCAIKFKVETFNKLFDINLFHYSKHKDIDYYIIRYQVYTVYTSTTKSILMMTTLKSYITYIFQKYIIIWSLV